jgi:hypothetical protein
MRQTRSCLVRHHLSKERDDRCQLFGWDGHNNLVVILEDEHRSQSGKFSPKATEREAKQVCA